MTTSGKYFNIDGSPAPLAHGFTPPKGETIVHVTEAENYVVVLGAFGFYVVCAVPGDTYVSDWMHAKHRARALADSKERGE